MFFGAFKKYLSTFQVEIYYKFHFLKNTQFQTMQDKKSWDTFKIITLMWHNILLYWFPRLRKLFNASCNPPSPQAMLIKLITSILVRGIVNFQHCLGGRGSTSKFRTYCGNCPKTFVPHCLKTTAFRKLALALSKVDEFGQIT